jgi:hypothetical protein
MRSHINWNEAEWELISLAVRALRFTNPELSRAELLSDAMDHLPASRRRSVNTSNLHSVFQKLVELQNQEVAEEVTRANSRPLAKEELITSDLPLAHEVSLGNIKELLNANLAEVKISILESERRQVEMMDRLFRKMAGMWTSEEEVSTLFAKDIAGLHKSIEVLTEIRIASLKRRELQPGELPTTRKPRLMIFGAQPSQREGLQRKLPQVNVEVGKDIKCLKGQFQMIVALVSCLKPHDRDHLNKNYPGRWVSINGSLTRAVEAARNHLMLA